MTDRSDQPAQRCQSVFLCKACQIVFDDLGALFDSIGKRLCYISYGNNYLNDFVQLVEYGIGCHLGNLRFSIEAGSFVQDSGGPMRT